MVKSTVRIVNRLLWVLDNSQLSVSHRAF